MICPQLLSLANERKTWTTKSNVFSARQLIRIIMLLIHRTCIHWRSMPTINVISLDFDQLARRISNSDLNRNSDWWAFIYFGFTHKIERIHLVLCVFLLKQKIHDAIEKCLEQSEPQNGNSRPVTSHRIASHKTGEFQCAPQTMMLYRLRYTHTHTNVSWHYVICYYAVNNGYSLTTAPSHQETAFLFSRYASMYVTI